MPGNGVSLSTNVDSVKHTASIANHECICLLSMCAKVVWNLLFQTQQRSSKGLTASLSIKCDLTISESVMAKTFAKPSW